MKLYKQIFSIKNGVEYYIYDYNAIELIKLYDVQSNIYCDFSSYIYLSDKYIKSCKYDLYMRMTKHKYFSKTVEYEVIYKNRFYHIVLDNSDKVIVNDKVVGLDSIDCIAMLSGDLVIKGYSGNIILEQCEGIEIEEPSDFILLEDEYTSDDIIEMKETIEVKDNNIVLNGENTYSFSEVYNYLESIRCTGLLIGEYEVPMSYIKVLNYLFGDFKILYVSYAYTLEEMCFEYKELPNGGTIYPYKGADIYGYEYYRGFYYCNDNKVFLLDLYEFLLEVIDEDMVLCELDDGRLVLLSFSFIFTIEYGGIFEYGSSTSKYNCICDMTEKQLKRKYLLHRRE